MNKLFLTCRNKKVLSLQPRNHYVAFHLAESYNALGDKAGAEEMYGKVLSIMSKSGTSAVKLGKLLISQKRYFEAVPILLSGVEYNPHLVEGLQLLKKCYAELGNTEKVNEMVRLVTSKTAENKLTAQSLVKKALKEVISEGSAELAGKYLRRAVEVDPENDEARLQLGILIVDNHQMPYFLKGKQM